MKTDEIKPILDVVTACDAVIMATVDDNNMPDARHVTNAMNRNATDLNLYFMTSRQTPKFHQISKNPNACLYFFDDKTRHAVRLYGKINFITDMNTRREYWRDEYRKFGYDGPDSSDFMLMNFIPCSYKYYIGPKIYSGKI